MEGHRISLPGIRHGSLYTSGVRYAKILFILLKSASILLNLPHCLKIRHGTNFLDHMHDGNSVPLASQVRIAAMLLLFLGQF